MPLWLYIRAMKNLFKALFVAFFLFSNSLIAQTPDHEGSLVKWMSLKEAMEKNETNPKPIILDFYTDWCGWCKHMMKTTYADPGLASYINSYFYPAKFDAEGKDTIDYLGQKYFPTTDKPRTPHPLAVKLLSGRLSYPTTLFLNGYNKEKKEFGLNMTAAGYIETRKFEPMLIFSLENVFRNSNYDNFREQYEKAFFDSTLDSKNEGLKWIMAKDFFTTKPVNSRKKTIVYINTEWCNGCKVMKRTSFSDDKVFSYIKEKFDIVDFNPESTDTLFYNGQSFSPKSNNTAFHSLAFNLTKGGFSFPTTVFLDEKGNVIDAIPSYLTPASMDDIVHYFGENLNKVKSWQDYMIDRRK